MTQRSIDPPDVPSRIDLRSMVDAREWAESAMVKRPWRNEFFEKIAQEVPAGHVSVLEIGSGPGFLAQRLFHGHSRYSALDFSPAMHALARERLGELTDRVQFIEADFTGEGWEHDLPRLMWW